MVGGAVPGVEGAGTSTSGVDGWTSGGDGTGSGCVGGAGVSGCAGIPGCSGGFVDKIFLLQRHKRAAELRGCARVRLAPAPISNDRNGWPADVTLLSRQPILKHSNRHDETTFLPVVNEFPAKLPGNASSD